MNKQNRIPKFKTIKFRSGTLHSGIKTLIRDVVGQNNTGYYVRAFGYKNFFVNFSEVICGK